MLTLNAKKYVFLFLTAVILISSSVNTSASILVTPKNSNEEKSLFYKAKPGEVISDTLDIKNTDSTPSAINIQLNDIVVTEDGTVTLIQNQEPNKSLASWTKALSGLVTIEASTNVNIPIQINIPTDAKTGEYGAAISISTQSQDSANLGIQNTVRKGLKIYVFVGDGNLPTASSVISSIKLLNPQSSDKDNLVKKLNFWDKNNMVFSFKAENKGNVFSVIKGKYTITCSNGENKTIEFTTNLVPNTGEKEYYISTNLPYKSGKTKISLDYTVEALNKNDLGETKNENISGSLTDEIDLNEKTLSSFRGIDKVQALVSSENKQVKVVKNLMIILLALAGCFTLSKVVRLNKKVLTKSK
jgi:sporulation-control protein spo0M